MAKLSPMMQQYFEIKNEYKDAILFFRLGDFYEMFYDDAITASKELELTLTGRDCGQEERAPMCGVPYHSADQYINKLIEKGYKVAICEQAEDPAQAKGIVKREVVRVVTAGTVTNTGMLDERSNNFLCCVYMDKLCGISFVDITTGDLFATEIDADISAILTELARYNPAEIIANSTFCGDQKITQQIRQRFGSYISCFNDWCFTMDFANDRLEGHFEKAVSGLPVAGYEHAAIAVGALLEYLSQTQMCRLPHISEINYYSGGQFMDIDFSTRRNLEITATMRENKRRGSLLWVMDDTKTSMGARMLKSWIEKPLISCVHINKRLLAVDELFGSTIMRNELRAELSTIQDIERLLGRVVTGSANGRDLMSLGNSLKPIPALLSHLKEAKSELLCEIHENIDPLLDICDLLERAIIENPPFTIREGGIIREGFSEQVDINRRAIREGKQWIANLEQTEREKTGIKNLKVGFNKVFGYYIEVSKSNIPLVPNHYTRKQTLANCERYITQELKELEDKILGAEERICQLEYSIFCDVRDMVAAANARIQKTAKAIAILDTLCSFAEIAVKNNFCLPKVDISDKLIIKDGRHPVVEKTLSGQMFVPNDAILDSNDRFAIITGPNMAGKSTYMRQVAIIVLMAQVGSFVPASSAHIGVVDKIFTRVGASDDLASGQSTFMVEMNEVAHILNNATSKSLIILDEIGRGTSTYDGLSIAWAVVEYIADTKKIGAKTLFATHYHELTELEGKVDGVKNYCIAVKKRGDDITFLRKIIRGGADDSYGIEVAKLAGVKNEVINRAKEIVNTLEGLNINKTDSVRIKETKKSESPQDTGQIGLASFEGQEIVEALKKLDVNTITPIEALNEIYKLKLRAEKL
ncbi:MAG: DNA mismatch repair protein MutS [Eubacteriales bacterium]|jgi:DNA mismatch repair protein MutS|nr:DNA mismatch repair protein MutS [Eubacteriales bacterium]